MTYLKRDGRMYELVAQDLRRNYGLGGSFCREAALRDVVSEETVFATGDTLTHFEPIGGAL